MNDDELVREYLDEQLRQTPQVNPAGVLAWTVSLLLWATSVPLVLLVWRAAW